MAEDWDLYAVVRRCTSAANSSRATESNDDSRNENRSSSSSFREDPLACLASLTFEEEDDPFRFPNISQQNGSLQDSYKPFLPNVANPTTTTTNQGVEPCSSSSLPGGSSGRQLHHHQRLQPPEQPTTTASIEIGSPLTPTSAPIFDFSGFTNQQQQSQSPPLIDRLNLPQKQLQQRVQPQVPRSRKRKNQQKRTVCHVTADNLSSDPWAWRKYGQKPIKGSPYPRNYYRCSSTKGCLARKQVERSHLDPNIFIITYTGEHTHPKPTHRNSLAGSTRNKVSTVQKGATTTKDSAVDTNPTASCSSPRSTACLSPISPTTTLSVPEDAVATVHNSEGEEDSIDMAGESDDDDYLLIPNVHVDEDLFKGLEELVGSGGVERSPTFGDNFSSWSPGNSTAAGAAASDGC